MSSSINLVVISRNYLLFLSGIIRKSTLYI